MEQLGERIKRLRKERKMTLADVAGNRLTKGMLSLIENGKANPSMESLQYIASQLRIDTSELVQSNENNSLREVLLQAENIGQELSSTFSKEKEEELKQQLLQLIKPLLEDGYLNGNTYEEARLFEIYYRTLYLTTGELDNTQFERLAIMYEKLHAFSRTLKVYSAMCVADFNNRNFEQALNILLEGEKKLQQYEYFIDDLEKLDFYYNIMVIYAALNNEKKAEHYINLALEISKKKKVFYRISDFYRFIFYVHLQKNENDKCHYYLEKIKLLAELMEDPLELMTKDILVLTYYNYVTKEYEKVLQYEIPEERLEIIGGAAAFLNTQKGIAYYQLQQYTEAFNAVKELSIPEFSNHPIDLSILYEGFAIRALCRFELNDVEEAKRDILYAYDGIKDFADTINKQFIMKSYEKIMNTKL